MEDGVYTSCWSSVLADIDLKYPFLTFLGVKLSEAGQPFQLPAILRIGAAIAIRANSETAAKRVCVTFPQIADCAKWMAIGTAMWQMRDDFLVGRTHLKPLTPGDRLVGDRSHYVEYVQTELINGVQFLRLKMSEKQNAYFLLPAKQRIRLQHTASRRPLSRKPMPMGSPDVLDSILGIEAFGNRSIFVSSVLLVSPLNKTRDWASRMFLQPNWRTQGETRAAAIVTAFQWAGVDRDGSLDNWGPGQLEAAPALIVSPDLYSAEDLLTAGDSQVKLILIDGQARLSSQIQNLDELLDAGLPVCVAAECDDYESLGLLRRRGFVFWNWTKEDLGSAELFTSGGTSREDPFSRTWRTLRNFRDGQIIPIACRHLGLEAACSHLFQLEKNLPKEQEQLHALIGQSFGCLLQLVRSTLPFSDASTVARVSDRLTQVETELGRNKVWITKEATVVVQEILSKLRTAVQDGENPKHAAIEAAVEQLNASGCSSVAVIVSHVNDVAPSSSHWHRRFPIHAPTVTTTSALDTDRSFDAVVLVGWLGSERMHKALCAYSAPLVYVLSYPFEQQWLLSAQNRWQWMNRPGTENRASLLGLNFPTEVPAVAEPKMPPKDPNTASIDLEDFEFRMSLCRSQALAISRNQSESNVEARFVEFADDRVAFLTEHYHVPVVTDYIQGRGFGKEIPQKTISELSVGDYLLFRESAEGNVIRAIADRGLAASGKGHLRKMAGIWREALRRLRDRLHGDSQLVIRALRDRGCSISDTTIRHWLNTDFTIGPRNDTDLESIASATFDPDLRKNLPGVREAITEVRSAHLQASGYLVKKLIEQVPTHLIDKTASSLSIDIEGLGAAAVVQIQELSITTVHVAESRVNRLIDPGAD